MKARNAQVTEETQRQVAKLQQLGYYHSIELPGGGVIQGLQTVEQMRWRVDQFPIPADLTGKRVLDIGAWDGWFTFEMERRGASVVAVDLVRNERFFAARDLIGSRAEYIVSDVYDLHPSKLGTFDIVLFLGVLYHLKHPLLGLERVCALAKDLVCVESYVTDDGSDPNRKPEMEFYEGVELCGQFDNWVGPNTSCLLSFCRTAGFARVGLSSVRDNRAHIVCHRSWDAPIDPARPAPWIVCVENAVSRDNSFAPEADDYLSIWFKSPHDRPLTPDRVFPEIGGFASRPAMLTHTGGDGWHVVAKLPPCIGAGWRTVRIRQEESPWSNEAEIGVGIPPSERQSRSNPSPAPGDPSIEIIADGRTWDRHQIRSGQGACLSLWVRHLRSAAPSVRIRFRGVDLPAIFVSELDPNGLRQVNAMLPSGTEAGSAEVNVVDAGRVSVPVTIAVVAA